MARLGLTCALFLGMLSTGRTALADIPPPPLPADSTLSYLSIGAAGLALVLAGAFVVRRVRGNGRSSGQGE